MRLSHFIVLVLLGAMWGAAFPLLRFASPEFGPVPLVAVRLLVATLVLVPYARELREIVASWRKLFVLGLMNTTVPFALFSFATLSITAGLASLLNSTTPMFGALVAYLWLNERLDAWRVVGIALGFIGVAFIVRGEIGGHADDALPGVLAGLAGAALYGVAASYGKRQLATIAPPVLAAGSVLGALLAVVPFAVVTWPAEPPSAKAWLAVIVLGLLSTAAAYVIYFRLLQHIKASQAVTVTFWIPVFGILWGALFLDEPVTAALLQSAGLVLLGTALATGVLRPPARAPTP
jgi:drug/metabolite transporter (DMT)-like permease